MRATGRQDGCTNILAMYRGGRRHAAVRGRTLCGRMVAEPLRFSIKARTHQPGPGLFYVCNSRIL